MTNEGAESGPYGVEALRRLVKRREIPATGMRTLLCLLLLGASVAPGAECRGEFPCRACRDCSQCRYCRPGGKGSCSVKGDAAQRESERRKAQGERQRQKRSVPPL